MKNHNHFYFQAEIDYSLNSLRSSKDRFYQLLIDTELNLIQIDYSFIVFSELLDNAYKYGSSNTLLNGIVWKYTIEDGYVSISTLNAIKNREDLNYIKEIIEKIENPQKEDPYIFRLKQIFESPDQPKNLLGLYRIASEAKFAIQFQYTNEILEIKAKRRF